MNNREYLKKSTIVMMQDGRIRKLRNIIQRDSIRVQMHCMIQAFPLRQER